MKRLLALALLLAPVIAGEPKVLSDDWQVMQIAGKGHGYVHKRMVQRDDVIETTIESKIVMKRGGEEVKIDTLETTEERASDGAILHIRSRQKMSNWDVEADVHFEEYEGPTGPSTKAVKVTNIAGKARESTQECGKGLVGPHWIEEAPLRLGLEPGAKLKARTYVSDLGGPTDVTVTVVGEEEVELLDGKKETLIRTELLLMPGLKQISWIEPAGRVKKTNVAYAGMNMETFLATEERAKGTLEAAPGHLPDSFDLSLLAPLHPIPHPRRLDRATYRIRAKEQMPDFDDSRQVVEKREEDGSIVLRVDRRVPAEGHTGTRPLDNPPPELATCLAASSMVQSDAPQIAKIAREVVGDEKDAWKAAQKLESWVYVNLTKKSMDVGFASALEVCETRQGDCTEHAVFLCALCRAAGIPARVLMGVVCIGNAFGGHAWNEVWIDDDWYALDATLGRGSVDPTHLTLAHMSMEDSAGAEAFTGLVLGLGNLEIDPVEVVLEGKRLRPAEDACKIEGDRFESRLWGLAFTLPEGFEFAPPDKKAAMTARIMDLVGTTADGKRVGIGIEATDGAVWEMVRGAAGRFDSVEEFKLDGRPALRVAKDGRRGVYVLANGGCLVFEMRPAEGEAAAAAFEKLLTSVDLDTE